MVEFYKDNNYNYQDEIKASSPSLVIGDPIRLNQILLNLTGNAIKFTEKGKVSIVLKIENNQLKFSVKDTGVGIAKDKLSKIFQVFEQAKTTTNRIYGGGIGLSLSISKHLTELQGGKIWVESEIGKGSTFYVLLSIVFADANGISQDILTEEQLKTMMSSLKGLRVLLAEDNDFNQMIVQDDLSFYIENVQIETVENGVLALEKFKNSSYDLILIDVQIPEINGFEVTKAIR
jgi:DNA topoisomerase VI subunit B